MSEAGYRMETMKTYQVEYTAVYWVKANSEDEAIELAIQEHEEMPNGDWEAFIEPWNPDNSNTA